VLVTNGSGSVLLSGPVSSGITQQVQRVRTLTTSGEVISNASVLRNSGRPIVRHFTPTPVSTVRQEFLTPGNSGPVDSHCHNLMDIPIRSLGTCPRYHGSVQHRSPEVTLVFPDLLVGPRIFGTVRTPTGAGVPSIPVSLNMADPGPTTARGA